MAEPHAASLDIDPTAEVVGSSPRERTDVELLLAARTDAEPFGEFYLRHANQLLDYFRLRCRTIQDGYDLVAETFAEVLQHVDRFDPDRGEPIAWVYGIAKHKLHHYVRRGEVESRARARIGLPTEPLAAAELEAIEDAIDLTEANAQVRTSIRRLPEGTAEAVHLRYIEGLGYATIAELLDISEANARQRVSRGISRLADVLHPNPFEFHD